MNNNLLNILFGIGLGNADYSNYSMFTSKFYNDYSFLHYQWFSSLFVFLETGMVGLISYLMIFVSAFFQGIRKMGKETSDTSFYMIMVIFMIIFVFYGIIMRCEQSGFILFMILALPTALQREKRKNYDT
jgi:O-antigen ligase